jgi:hypothetical protein
MVDQCEALADTTKLTETETIFTTVVGKKEGEEANMF